MSTSTGALQTTYPGQNRNWQTDVLQTDPTDNRKIEADQWRWQTLHEYSGQPPEAFYSQKNNSCMPCVPMFLLCYFYCVLVPTVIRKMTVEVEGHQNHDRGHGALGKLSFDINFCQLLASWLSWFSPIARSLSWQKVNSYTFVLKCFMLFKPWQITSHSRRWAAVT